MDRLISILQQYLASCIEQLVANALALRRAVAEAWAEGMRGLGESVGAGIGELLVLAALMAAGLLIVLVLCVSTLVSALRRLPSPIEILASGRE